MNCETTIRLLETATSHELENSPELKEHIASCAKCMEVYIINRKLERVIEFEKSMELPGDFTENLFNRLNGQPKLRKLETSRWAFSRVASVAIFIAFNMTLGIILGSKLNATLDSTAVVMQQDELAFEAEFDSIDLALTSYEQ